MSDLHRVYPACPPKRAQGGAVRLSLVEVLSKGASVSTCLDINVLAVAYLQFILNGDICVMFRLVLFFFLIAVSAEAQKQLVLLKRGKPVGRYVEDEYVYFVMKDGSRKEGTILELMEFSALITVRPKGDTSRTIPYDTIRFNKVHKILIPKKQRKGIAPLFGGLFMAAGAAYLAIDLVNSAAGYNTAGIDKSVVTASVTLMGVGSLLVFIKPTYRRVNNGTVLRTVDRTSKFYKNLTGE